MTAEQRAQIRARLRDKKQRAQSARARKQAEQGLSKSASRGSRNASHGLEASSPAASHSSSAASDHFGVTVTLTLLLVGLRSDCWPSATVAVLTIVWAADGAWVEGA